MTLETPVRQDPHPSTAPRHGWRAVQVLVIAGAVVAYFGIRGLTEGATDLAVHNAERLVALERLLGLAWEADLQRAVIDVPLVTTLANWIYIYGHWPFIIVVLSWLVIRHRSVFERVRDAMLASGGVGLVIFATLPMAPPRLAGIGLVDTVTARSNSYRVLQPAAFTNQYAAMPSLHVGWNLVVSLALIVATQRLWLRVLAVAATLSMDAAVVLTANHYILDVVAGLILAGAAWLLIGWRAHPRSRPTAPDGVPLVPAHRPDTAGQTRCLPGRQHQYLGPGEQGGTDRHVDHPAAAAGVFERPLGRWVGSPQQVLAEPGRSRVGGVVGDKQRGHAAGGECGQR
jgi:membrane-associated phospholipid phosphatase